MRDVADRAGVSTSTVSHVMNGTRYVAEELAARVRAAMAELDYQPNALARSLRRKKTLTLGMVVPDSANPFFAALARAVEDACFREGYSLFLANSAGAPERERRNLEVLLAKQVDGLIFVPASEESAQLLQTPLGVPVVVVDRELPGMDADAVLVDNEGGAMQATQHLIELGHRRIAHVAGPAGVGVAADRRRGYERALEAAGLPVETDLVMGAAFSFAAGCAAALELLSLRLPPTAVCATNDLVAVGVLAGAAQSGHAVPRDLSVIGFDGIALGGYTTPALTTMAQPTGQLGTLATQLLIRRIADPGIAPERHVLATELVVRESTAVTP